MDRETKLAKFIALARVLLMATATYLLARSLDYPSAALSAAYMALIASLAASRMLAPALARPPFLTLDFFFAVALVMTSGGYIKSPFLLYSYAPIVAIGLHVSTRAGFTAGTLMALLQVGSLIFDDHAIVHLLNGHIIFGSVSLASPGQMIGRTFMYLLAGTSAGYIGDLQKLTERMIDRNDAAKRGLKEAIEREEKLRRELVAVNDIAGAMTSSRDKPQLAAILLRETAKRLDINHAVVVFREADSTEYDVYAREPMPGIMYGQMLTIETSSIWKAKGDLPSFSEAREDAWTFLYSGELSDSQAGLLVSKSELLILEPQSLQALCLQLDAVAASLVLNQAERRLAQVKERECIWRELMPHISDRLSDCAERCAALVGSAESARLLKETGVIENNARDMQVELRKAIGRLKE